MPIPHIFYPQSGPVDASQLDDNFTYLEALILATIAPQPEATGSIKSWPASSAPSGWLSCDWSAVSRTTYSALFAIIGSNFGPGDGSTTFNLPDLRGRVPLGIGTGALADTASSVDDPTDAFIVASNADKWTTGMAITLTTSGALPTGLSLATTYYTIRNSATSVSFATTLANAVAGTKKTFTGGGSGAHTINAVLTARSLADLGGEEAHANTIGDIPSHTHGWRAGASGVAKNLDEGLMADTPLTGTLNTNSVKGGSGAHNNMQPYLALNWIIKT